MYYDGWDRNPMQNPMHDCWRNSMRDFAYPINYHNMYGYMYPNMEPEMSGGMVYPTMYPDIYYRIYPYVHRTCDRMDNPYMMYPSESQVESMVNECYDMCVKAMPDLHEYAELHSEEGQKAEASQFFRRRPLLRDLIAIILISELFRRRRRRFPFGNFEF